jgi:hypothetical protein
MFLKKNKHKFLLNFNVVVKFITYISKTVVRLHATVNILANVSGVHSPPSGNRTVPGYNALGSKWLEIRSNSLAQELIM